MDEPELTPEQLRRLLSFVGYGNPAAPYWFLGMEEGGGSHRELRIRGDQFQVFEDRRRAQRLISPNRNPRVFPTSTWSTMIRLVFRLEGRPGWREINSLRDYLEGNLGAPDGETFLVEMLPLPKASINAWPYAALYPSLDDYRSAVLPTRIRMLRELWQKHRPRYVFAYGKGNWPHYREVFDGIEFTAVLDGAAFVGRGSGSTVALTMFFDPTLGFTNDFLDRLCSEVGSN